MPKIIDRKLAWSRVNIQSLQTNSKGATDERPRPETSKLVLLLLVQFLVSLLAIYLLYSQVKPKPDTYLGYFSFENITPSLYWPMLIVCTLLCFLIIREGTDKFSTLSLVMMIVVIRSPMIFLFDMPAGYDSYAYASVVAQWRNNGVSLVADPRTAWPVAFLLPYAFTYVGVNPLDFLRFSPIFLYSLNTATIFVILRRLFGSRTASLASFAVVLMPLFNLYYFSTYTQQLLASSLLLLALYTLITYHSKHGHLRLAFFTALSAVLIFTHHVTVLLFAGVLIAPWILLHVRSVLDRIRLRFPRVIPNAADDAKIGVVMAIASLAYFQTLSASLFGRYLMSLGLGEYPSQALLYRYPFSLQSLGVYGERIFPILIPLLLFSTLILAWYIPLRKKVELNNPEAWCASIVLAFLGVILISLLALQGRFIEALRFADAAVLFSSPFAAIALIRNRRRLRLLRTCIIFALVLAAPLTSLGVATHDVQFTYYAEETKAVLIISQTHPTATIFTDERLINFVAYFAPKANVTIIPANASQMMTTACGADSAPVFVLISSHSISYNAFRQTFHGPIADLIVTLERNTQLLYSENGVWLYELQKSQATHPQTLTDGAASLRNVRHPEPSAVRNLQRVRGSSDPTRNCCDQPILPKMNT